MTTDLPICAKSADNGALMDVLLKEAGYCSTRITGKAGTGTAASLPSTIPNYESMRQARRFRGSGSIWVFSANSAAFLRVLCGSSVLANAEFAEKTQTMRTGLVAQGGLIAAKHSLQPGAAPATLTTRWLARGKRGWERVCCERV